jgi:hypothetical protein
MNKDGKNHPMLGTPLGRAGFVVMVFGMLVLCVSFALWHSPNKAGHRLFYSEPIYGWVESGSKTLPITQFSDTAWTFTEECIRPYRRAKSSAFAPFSAEASSGRRILYEGDVLRGASIFDPSAVARALGNKDAEDQRSDAEKVIDHFANVMRLPEMSRDRAKSLLESCSYKSGVLIQIVRTEYKTDISGFLLDRPWLSWTGVALAVLGFFTLICGTPIVRWIRG